MTAKFILAAAIGVLAVAPLAPALAGPGKMTGQSRSSVNRPAGNGGGGAMGGKSRSGGGAGNNRNGGGNVGNSRSGNRGNVNVGNSVNVNTNGNRNGGYNNGYNNGRHDVVVVGNNGRNDWDNNDNDFLEFVGKTAAITAGASIVAAVIKDKPAGCQPVMNGGVQYQSCNGVLYQQVPGGYQQMPPQ